MLAIVRSGMIISCYLSFVDFLLYFRYERVKSKLLPHMRSLSIICLQELTQEWHDRLLPLFSSYNYTLLSSHYGPQRSGYMGTAMAFPSSLYSLEEAKITKLTDLKFWGERERDIQGDRLISVISFLLKILFFFVNFFFSWMLNKPLCYSLYFRDGGDIQKAKDKNNSVIMIKLSKKVKLLEQGDEDASPPSSPSSPSTSFVIATYHMPCEFQKPNIMHLHISLLFNSVEKFAKKDPYIVTGDFNITPPSEAYHLITKGHLPPEEMNRFLSAIPKDGLVTEKDVVVSQPMLSAYAVRLGEEPPLTNYKVEEYDGKLSDFSGTLDYIWVKPGITVENVIQLPLGRSDFPTPLPTLEEPSDHLLLGADLKI